MTASRLGACGRRRWLGLGLSLATAIAACGVSNWALAADAPQRDFATPEQAIDALIAAVRSNDQHAQLRILGPSGEKLIHSGDRVADRAGRRRLIEAYEAAHRIEVEAASATLIVGQEDWALPIPVVKQSERWHFDTQASAQKIIDRRVGRNELNVIEVCRAYLAAQREYASRDRLGDGLHEYAQSFESHAGLHDGLYWEAAASEEQSPLGPLAASAHAEGYPGEGLHGRRSPYHGYYFRILKSQGNHAPGGARNYLVGGHMTGGFALLGFPAKWGDSGVMTFMVNQDGIVFQKNLGPDTEQLAREITQYDPDLSWTTP